MRRSTWFVFVSGVSTWLGGCSIEDLPFFPSLPEPDDSVEGSVVDGGVYLPPEEPVVELGEADTDDAGDTGAEVEEPALDADYPGDLVLSSEGDIEAFCDDFVGVEGDLTLTGDALVSLLGLSCLERIGGDLRVESAPALTTLRGLEGLQGLDGSLTIRDTVALTDLDGLGGIVRVNGDLVLDWNTALTSLEGLSSLQIVGGSLELGRLRYVRELSGLRSLSGVGGDLVLGSLNRLEDLDGLSALNLVEGSLLIDDNAQLQRVDGLSGIGGLGGDLSITFNPWLPTSEATALRDNIGVENIAGSVTITGNAEG
jgi:hypothetical protein